MVEDKYERYLLMKFIGLWLCFFAIAGTLLFSYLHVHRKPIVTAQVETMEVRRDRVLDAYSKRTCYVLKDHSERRYCIAMKLEQVLTCSSISDPDIQVQCIKDVKVLLNE